MYSVIVLNCQTLTSGYHIIDLQKPVGYEFDYGQYLTFGLLSEHQEPRHYAIASTHHDLNLRLLLAPSHAPIPVGTTLSISEPRGPGFRQGLDRSRDILMLTHGSGISAFLGILKDRFEQFADRKVHCLWGIPTTAPLDILASFDIQKAHSFVVPIYSKEKKNPSGHIQDQMVAWYRPGMVILLAGSNQMVQQTHTALLELGATGADIYLNW